MERRTIHVFINNKPYRFVLDILTEGDTTTYRIEPDRQTKLLEDFIPERLEFNVNGDLHFDDRIATVEGAEIAKTIWDGIQRELNKESD